MIIRNVFTKQGIFLTVSPKGFVLPATVLTTLLLGLCGTVWLWGTANISLPCGTGLGCSLRTLTLGPIRLRPYQLAPASLGVPILLILLPQWQAWLRPLQWVQAIIALSLQAATWRITGSVCPYCVGITALHWALAIVVTWSLPFRLNAFKFAFPVIATGTLFALGYSFWRLEDIRLRPLDLGRVNALSQIPELVPLGTRSREKADWLVIIDPECPQCDAALGRIAGKIEAGDSAGLLLMAAGRDRRGGVLLAALEGSQTVGAQADALRHWPEVRRKRTKKPLPESIRQHLDRQLLRARSLAVQQAPLVLVRYGDGPYLLNP